MCVCDGGWRERGGGRERWVLGRDRQTDLRGRESCSTSPCKQERLLPCEVQLVGVCLCGFSADIVLGRRRKSKTLMAGCRCNLTPGPGLDPLPGLMGCNGCIHLISGSCGIVIIHCSPKAGRKSREAPLYKVKVIVWCVTA